MGLLNAAEHTAFNAASAAQFRYNGTDFKYQGAGHLCGTHIMGASSSDSVVNSYQQAFGHDNLFLCGCGSMPSIGTENPTLTMLAMACRPARYIGENFT